MADFDEDYMALGKALVLASYALYTERITRKRFPLEFQKITKLLIGDIKDSSFETYSEKFDFNIAKIFGPKRDILDSEDAKKPFLICSAHMGEVGKGYAGLGRIISDSFRNYGGLECALEEIRKETVSDA